MGTVISSDPSNAFSGENDERDMNWNSESVHSTKPTENQEIGPPKGQKACLGKNPMSLISGKNSISQRKNGGRMCLTGRRIFCTSGQLRQPIGTRLLILGGSEHVAYGKSEIP